MSKERAPYYLKSEEQASTAHEHRSHVVTGDMGLVIRWCERCGKSFLLEQVNELIHGTITYQWEEIQEASPVDVNDTYQTLTVERISD